VLVYSLLLPLGIGVLYACLIRAVLAGAAYAVAGLSCGVVGAVPSVMVGLFRRRCGVGDFVHLQHRLCAVGEYTPLMLIG
jgi:hypothetical protein